LGAGLGALKATFMMRGMSYSTEQQLPYNVVSRILLVTREYSLRTNRMWRHCRGRCEGLYTLSIVVLEVSIQSSLLAPSGRLHRSSLSPHGGQASSLYRRLMKCSTLWPQGKRRPIPRVLRAFNQSGGGRHESCNYTAFSDSCCPRQRI
jgi:hypothetical protein